MIGPWKGQCANHRSNLNLGVLRREIFPQDPDCQGCAQEGDDGHDNHMVTLSRQSACMFQARKERQFVKSHKLKEPTVKRTYFKVREITMSLALWNGKSLVCRDRLKRGRNATGTWC